MKFNAKKILTPGAILLALSAVLGLVAVILYAVNVSASGYFQGALVGIVPAMGVVSIVLALLAIVSGMVEVDGVLGQVLEYGRNVLMLLVPIFFMVSALAFIGARAEGLAYIFGSESNILATIQTPENLSSSFTAIAGFVLFLLSSIVSIVANFFRLTRKEKAVEEAHA